jgi:hypothetical protein
MNRQQGQCGDSFNVICVHLQSGEARDWHRVVWGEDDWLCSACFRLEGGPGVSVANLVLVCSDCMRRLQVGMRLHEEAAPPFLGGRLPGGAWAQKMSRAWLGLTT